MANQPIAPPPSIVVLGHRYYVPARLAGGFILFYYPFCFPGRSFGRIHTPSAAFSTKGRCHRCLPPPAIFSLRFYHAQGASLLLPVDLSSNFADPTFSDFQRLYEEKNAHKNTLLVSNPAGHRLSVLTYSTCNKASLSGCRCCHTRTRRVAYVLWRDFWGNKKLPKKTMSFEI